MSLLKLLRPDAIALPEVGDPSLAQSKLETLATSFTAGIKTVAPQVTLPLAFDVASLHTVGTYLLWARRYGGSHDSGLIWEQIQDARKPIRAYSLFLHEATELLWYFVNYGRTVKLSPFVLAEQARGYRPAHSLALIAEHRFLAEVARALKCPCTLLDLLIANPVVTELQRGYDLVLVMRQRPPVGENRAESFYDEYVDREQGT